MRNITKLVSCSLVAIGAIGLVIVAPMAGYDTGMKVMLSSLGFLFAGAIVGAMVEDSKY